MTLPAHANSSWFVELAARTACDVCQPTSGTSCPSSHRSSRNRMVDGTTVSRYSEEFVVDCARHVTITYRLVVSPLSRLPTSIAASPYDPGTSAPAARSQ